MSLAAFLHTAMLFLCNDLPPMSWSKCNMWEKSIIAPGSTSWKQIYSAERGLNSICWDVRIGAEIIPI